MHGSGLQSRLRQFDSDPCSKISCLGSWRIPLRQSQLVQVPRPGYLGEQTFLAIKCGSRNARTGTLVTGRVRTQLGRRFLCGADVRRVTSGGRHGFPKRVCAADWAPSQ